MAKPDNAPFFLSVLTGPNAGATAPLGAGRSMIGGGADDAIILQGVHAGQLAVTLDGQRVRLLAAQPGTRVGASADGTRPLAAGAAQILPLPAMVRLNDDTLISIARRTPATGQRLALRTAAMMAALALTGGLLIGLQLPPGTRLTPDMAALASTYPDETRATAEAAAAQVPTSPETAAPRLTATSPQLQPCVDACQREASAALSARLVEAGLSTLTVAAEDGVLRVSGSLPAERRAEWTEIRARFESDYGRSLPLVVATSDSAAGPTLAVASIWLGSRPELLTKSGQTLRIGDTTPDGWTVAAIARGSITLTRDESRVSVRF